MRVHRGGNLRYNFMVVPASGDPAYPLLPTPLSTPFAETDFLSANISNLYAVAFDPLYVARSRRCASLRSLAQHGHDRAAVANDRSSSRARAQWRLGPLVKRANNCRPACQHICCCPRRAAFQDCCTVRAPTVIHTHVPVSSPQPAHAPFTVRLLRSYACRAVSQGDAGAITNVVESVGQLVNAGGVLGLSAAADQQLRLAMAAALVQGVGLLPAIDADAAVAFILALRIVIYTAPTLSAALFATALPLLEPLAAQGAGAAVAFLDIASTMLRLNPVRLAGRGRDGTGPEQPRVSGLAPAALVVAVLTRCHISRGDRSSAGNRGRGERHHQEPRAADAVGVAGPSL